MKTIKLEIELMYDDEIMHGEHDQEAKTRFYRNVLLHPADHLILYSNGIGDELGEVDVLSIVNKRVS